MKTLLVDGDPRSQRPLVESLRRRNHAVSVMADADSACEAFRSEAFGLVVLDAEAAGGGVELCNRLRSQPNGRRAVILALTKSADPAHLASLVQAGFDDYLPNPAGDGEALDVRLAVAERLAGALAGAGQTVTHGQEAESHFRSLFENLPDFVVVVDSAGTIQLHNGSPHVAANQLVGASGFGFVVPAHQEACRESLRKACQTREVQFVEVRDVFGAWYDCRVVPMVEEGVVRQAMIICTDVTASKMALESLRQNNEELQAIYDGIADGVLIADVETTKYLRANSAMCRMLGYTEEAFLRLAIQNLHPPEAWLEVRERFESRRRGVNPDASDVPFLCRDGTIVYLDVAARPIVFQGRPCLIGFFRNVTERHRAEEALRESEQRFDLAARAAEAGIWDADLRTSRTYYSPRWKSMLGYGEGEISDRFDEWRDRVHPDDLAGVLAGRADYLEGRLPQYDCEYRIRHRDGSYRWIKACGVVLRDPQGRPCRFVGVHVDITERKEAEEAIRKERRLLRRLLDLHEQERKVLAYEIHDGFAQQLTGAFLQLQTYNHLKMHDPEQAQKALDTAGKLVVRSIDETRRLIGGLRPPVLDESGLVSAIDYLICETLEPAGIEVEFTHRLEVERLAPPLESAIFRIIQESLTNVRRHSHAEKARVQLVQEGQSVRIEVRDWGAGFDVDRVEPSHFGLQGISERARLLGGTATISSAPGAGTCICVVLPLVDAGSPLQGNPGCC
ncbi:MAG: PAS domain S-box protein [Pirellulales bacterium]